MAGALQVRLGGQNTYAGESILTPLLGSGFPPPTGDAARAAVSIVIRVSLIAVGAAVASALFFRRLRK